MDASLPYLRHFYEVARQRGFTRAAEALRAQQPGMSRSVRMLEDQLGVRLIERAPRAFALTAAGERVFAACARIFAEVEQIRTIADEERGALSGPLRIAASGVLASRLIPDALAPLTAAHARLWPMIYSAPAAMGMARIASGELELGIYFYTPDVPPMLVVTPLVDVAFRLVVRRDRARHVPTLCSFIGSREVEDPRATQFPTLELLRRRYPAAKIRISTNDQEAHLRMVEAGLGVSILPEPLVREGLAKRRLRDVLPRETFRFPILVVTRQRSVLSAGARALLDALAVKA